MNLIFGGFLILDLFPGPARRNPVHLQPGQGGLPQPGDGEDGRTDRHTLLNTGRVPFHQIQSVSQQIPIARFDSDGFKYVTEK